MQANLRLIRKWFTDKSTIGELYFDGKFFCYTLEDMVRNRDTKIYGKTAIPFGKYEVIINYSDRFKVQMPLVLNVDNFSGVRIHKGNKPEDTLGCILVGDGYKKDWISKSKKAYDRLFARLVKYDSIKLIIARVDRPEKENHV